MRRINQRIEPRGSDPYNEAAITELVTMFTTAGWLTAIRSCSVRAAWSACCLTREFVDMLSGIGFYQANLNQNRYPRKIEGPC